MAKVNGLSFCMPFTEKKIMTKVKVNSLFMVINIAFI